MPRPKKHQTFSRNNAGQFSSFKNSNSALHHHVGFSPSQESDEEDVFVISDSTDADDNWSSDDGTASEGTWAVIRDVQKKERKVRKQRNLAKLRADSVKSAEQLLDGPVDRAGGAKDKTGAKRGPYFRDSQRTAQRKRARVIQEAEELNIPVSDPKIQRRLQAISMSVRPPREVQTSITSFFGRKEDEELHVFDVSAASNLARGSPECEPEDRGTADGGASLSVMAEEEEESEASDAEGPESQATVIDAESNVDIDNTIPATEIESVEQTEEIAEFIECVLDDAAPKDPRELVALASEGLKKARNAHDYRSEVLFASLKDFYTWIPRQGRLRASLRIAKNHGRGPAFARVLCAQARHFEATGALKPSLQGRRTKRQSLLDDEATQMGIQSWLRTLEVGKINPKLLQIHLNTTLLPSLDTDKKTISLRQARRWLWRLGYRRKRHTKGVYWDGHERKDVKKRRQEFLQELESFEQYSAIYDGVDMTETPAAACDANGEREHVLIFHDESAFHGNDYKQDYWLKSDEQVLKKKDRGRLIMVSGFICQRFGNLALTENLKAANALLPEHLRLSVTDSRVTIYPTSKAGGDDYWNMEQMIEQLKLAIPIARRLFPDAIVHWVFDNSSCHGSLAKDALTVSKMNVGPGGKNVPHMHDTIIPFDNPAGLGGQVQTMQFDSPLPNDHPFKAFEGKPKGMRVILQERGILQPGMVGECRICKQAKSRKSHVTGMTQEESERVEGEEADDSEEEDERPADCCMRRALSMQADFINETSILEQVIAGAGDMQCHFLPKFHPELNPIEYYWGWAKQYFRERSNGNFARARTLVQEALDACPLITIRRFFRRAFRYVSVYRLGATGIVAEYAVRKFRSHRSVQQKDPEVAEAERAEKEAKLAARKV